MADPSCAFVAEAGPHYGRFGRGEGSACVHLFVERATCGVPQHAYHAVAQMVDSAWRPWVCMVLAESGLTMLMKGYSAPRTPFAMVPGYSRQQERFVLVPDRTKD